MKKLYLAGHTGMVGSAILRKLQNEGYTNLVLRTSKELDLRNQRAVNDFFEAEKPEIVIIASTKLYGILVNSINHNFYCKIFLGKWAIQLKQKENWGGKLKQSLMS